MNILQYITANQQFIVTDSHALFLHTARKHWYCVLTRHQAPALRHNAAVDRLIEKTAKLFTLKIN